MQGKQTPNDRRDIQKKIHKKVEGNYRGQVFEGQARHHLFGQNLTQSARCCEKITKKEVEYPLSGPGG